MRTLFWMLLLANVIIFALIQRGGLWRDDALVQAQPPLHEEKVRLLDQQYSEPLAKLPEPRPKPPAASHQFQSSMQLSLSISSPVATSNNTLACLEWGEFSGVEFKFATAALSSLNLGKKLDMRQVEQLIGYWVYMPPQGSKAAVNLKIAQLKARGIKEYFVVQDAGPWRYAISLGVFRTEEAAQNYLKVLRTKDVRTARVGERSGKQKAVIFILNGVGSAMQARLASMQKDFPGSELNNIPCEH